MSGTRVALLTLLLLFGRTFGAHAATYSLSASADAFVASSSALNADGSGAIRDSNYGGAGALSVAGSGLPKGEFDSLLRFDLAPAKANFDATFGTAAWFITSVTLELTLTAPNNPMFNGNGAGPGGTNLNFAGSVALWRMATDSWIEGTGRPNAPTSDGVTFSTLSLFLSPADEALGTYSFAGGTTGKITLSLGLAPSFLLDATSGNDVSLLLIPNDSGVAMLVNSSSATAGGHPLLNVTAVPEPACIASLAIGALIPIIRRNRHAAK